MANFAASVSFGGCIALAAVRAVISSNVNGMYGVKIDQDMLLTSLLSIGAAMIPAGFIAALSF